MIKICPHPRQWNETYVRLMRFARTHACTPPDPPTPLILSGWTASNDKDRQDRWADTIAWAEQNGCRKLVSHLKEEDYYFVSVVSTHEVGPMGGPMYRPWDYETKERPSDEALDKLMATLLVSWPEIVGVELAAVTSPLEFSGSKARRLIVQAHSGSRPPWGDWNYRVEDESTRRTFTRFRESINKAIYPHEIDHIDFVTL